MPLDLGRLTLGPAMRLYGANILYSRGADPAFPVPAVFDRRHAAVGLGEDGTPVSMLVAQLGVRLSRFPPGFTPEQGDAVQVALIGDRQVSAWPLATGGVLTPFVVKDVQPEGEGGAVLVLEAA
jgi:hypothetical protein